MNVMAEFAAAIIERRRPLTDADFGIEGYPDG